MTETSLTCWVISEGIAGTENQCLGLAAALGVTPEVKRVRLRWLWRKLSPWLPFIPMGLVADSDKIDGPYPDLIIASGRKAVGVALYLKRASCGRTFVVQVQDPRVDPDRFDMVVVPAHDCLRGGNVMVTDAALHRVTPDILADAAAQFPALAALPHPRVAVLVGGNSKSHTMTADDARALAEKLKGISGGSLMVTASRRTGAENEAILRAALTGENVFFWDGQGANPIFAMLGLADHIVVTEDSVSMTSEAVSTGKPVYIAPLSGGSVKFTRFHKHLRNKGYTRPFTGTLETWSYTPPHDTTNVANAIKQAIKRKG